MPRETPGGYSFFGLAANFLALAELWRLAAYLLVMLLAFIDQEQPYSVVNTT